ncbi:MAG: tetratricopeptide repeat protein [Bdellovibrionales bacterium]
MKSCRYGRWLSLVFGVGACVVVASFEAFAAKAPQLHKRVDLRAELTGRNLESMRDEELYVEFLSQYQLQDRFGMKRAAEILLRKYPASPHADNTLYLLGYSALETKEFSVALRYFQTLLRLYPGSNKAVAAEFAKGVAYRHMKLPDMAQRSFMKVRKTYPGSPESFRAESELKLLLRR